MIKSKIYTVKKLTEPQRLDVFLPLAMKTTRSQVQKYIDHGCVSVNGVPAHKTGVMVENGDKVEYIADAVVIEKKKKAVSFPEIPIVAETKEYLVIEKPAGLLVHPTEAGEQNTLAQWLLKKYPKMKNVGDTPGRPGIVHRLDKDASGLLVIAKNQKQFLALKQQFKDRTIDKEYAVLVYGVLKNNQVKLDFPIARGEQGRMAARPVIGEFRLRHAGITLDGKDAHSELFVEKKFGRFTLLRVKIYTGRTHQIRVHCFAYGHPVVGDIIYINKRMVKKGDQKIDRLFLHARKLSFTDLSGERMTFESQLPETLQTYLANLSVNTYL
jgi:23S rRNA pseudouridine1911/1915/1917 synthase